MSPNSNSQYTIIKIAIIAAFMLAPSFQACSDGCVTCYQDSICLDCQYGYDLNTADYTCSQWKPLLSLGIRGDDVLNYKKLKLAIEGSSSIPDSVDLSSNFQCIVGNKKCNFTMKKQSNTEYHVDIEYNSKVLTHQVVTFIYDGAATGVSFEESFATLYIPRFDSDLPQFGSELDLTFVGYILGISNLVVIAILILLTYIIQLKTGTFFIKPFLFRFLDSSNLWYILVFSNIYKTNMVITLIEGFNNSYWKMMRIIPLLDWIEFDQANYPDAVRESVNLVKTEASFLYNLQSVLVIFLVQLCFMIYQNYGKRVKISRRNWRIFWSVWFRLSTSMGGTWIMVELITKGKGVPIILYILNVVITIFDLTLLLGWMLLTEKINSLPYISMTMSKEYENIREEEEQIARQIESFKFQNEENSEFKEPKDFKEFKNIKEENSQPFDKISKDRENISTSLSSFRQMTTFIFDEKEDIDFSGLHYFFFQHVEIICVVIFQEYSIYQIGGLFLAQITYTVIAYRSDSVTFTSKMLEICRAAIFLMLTTLQLEYKLGSVVFNIQGALFFVIILLNIAHWSTEVYRVLKTYIQHFRQVNRISQIGKKSNNFFVAEPLHPQDLPKHGEQDEDSFSKAKVIDIKKSNSVRRGSKHSKKSKHKKHNKKERKSQFIRKPHIDDVDIGEGENSRINEKKRSKRSRKKSKSNIESSSDQQKQFGGIVKENKLKQGGSQRKLYPKANLSKKK